MRWAYQVAGLLGLNSKYRYHISCVPDSFSNLSDYLQLFSRTYGVGYCDHTYTYRLHISQIVASSKRH